MKTKLDLQRAKLHDSEKDVSSLKSHQMKKGITLTRKADIEIYYITI